MKKHQYIKTKQYLINYIGNLLIKPHVKNKTYLKQILNGLNKNGFINHKGHYKFLSRFLSYDLNHQDININEQLDLLEKHIKSEQTNTLEDFFK